MRFWYNPNFLAIFALVILSLPALKSLSQAGFYTSHDGETHTARIAQYYGAFADGQFPPRFAPSLYNGLGSPIFVYIYPLPYLLGSVLHAAGFSFVDSFKILMAASFILSGVFSYLWFKEVLKSEKAAFLGALFYIWGPYRFLLIYVRGSLSEALAYTFLPLVLFCVTKLVTCKNLLWISSTAVATSLLLLSQNLVALISFPIIIVYSALIAWQVKSLRAIVYSTLALIWGFLISSFVYLPTIFERKFTRFDEIITVAFQDHFVTLKQLIRSPWGYGFDLPGTVNDQMSFQIGLAHIIVFLISTILVIHQLARKKAKSETNIGIFFIVVLMLSTFLMLQSKITSYVWQHVKLLHTIDIPWRFLGLVSVSLSFLAAYATKYIKPGLFFLFLTAAVLAANRNHLRINQSVERNDSFFASYTETATQYNEFTPKWRQTTRVPIGFDPNIKVQTVSGQVGITSLRYSSREIDFIADVTSEKAQVRINKFYFPGLTVTDNSRELTIGNDLIITEAGTLRLDKEQDSSGLILLNLEKGTHQITANFGETDLRLFANFLSLTALILALGTIIRNVKK